jgi:aspartate/methionine/tyrosine aminotransferase
MHQRAVELNSILEGSVVARLLSSLGRRLYFPNGIISQSAEARKTAAINATIGMAYEQGKPLALKTITRYFPCLKGEESVVYAPTAGVEVLRTAWKNALVRKNPAMEGGRFSLPVVVPGITAGISYAADLFLDKTSVMIAGDPSWDNYELIFAGRRNAAVCAVPLFSGSNNGLDISAVRDAVREQAKTGAVRIILNFPNNPSGYTPMRAEAEALIRLIYETAQNADVLVLCDDAYFGLFYEDGVMKESLFSALCGMDERVLAVKIDGPTKEDYVWGFRTGFLTFGSKGMNEEQYGALIQKLMGVIRSSVSCSNTAAQYLALRTLEDPETAAEKERYFSLLGRRYRAVRRFIVENPLPSVLQVLPFNSGYFMSFRCVGISAERLRLALLEKGIGTIALGDVYLRITFAAVDEDDIPGLYRAVYQTAADLGGTSKLH